MSVESGATVPSVAAPQPPDGRGSPDGTAAIDTPAPYDHVTSAGTLNPAVVTAVGTAVVLVTGSSAAETAAALAEPVSPLPGGPGDGSLPGSAPAAVPWSCPRCGGTTRELFRSERRRSLYDFAGYLFGHLPGGRGKDTS